jgi:ribosomal protein L21E/mRNA-degrading endonuclease RelE of RelBE toxin-antitoxin system
MAKLNDINVKLSFESGQDIEMLAKEIARQLSDKLTEPNYRKVTGREPEVGNYVKFTEIHSCYDITVGKYYFIEEIDCADDPQIYDDKGEDFDCEGEEYEVYELISETTEPERLRVGDYAKVVEHKNDNYFGGKTGDIVKITEERERTYETEELGGGSYGYAPYAKKEALVKASDEEVAEAKSKFADKLEAEKESKKWASIGRKVNEYKVGDIVEFTDDYRGIGVVENVGATLIGVRIHDEPKGFQGPYIDDVTLLVPVEHRFDKDSAKEIA